MAGKDKKKQAKETADGFKTQHDKRATEKDRDWQREKGRVMREKG